MADSLPTPGAHVDDHHPSAPVPSRWRKWLTRWVLAYCVAIAVLWGWMYWDGDRGWLATLFLFSPRWLCALPLAVLAPAAIAVDRRLLWPLAATSLVILGPIMGLRAPLSLSGSQRGSLRVLTVNVGQRAVRVASLASLVEQLAPDVVALQEVRVGTPFQWPPGWHVIEHDEFILASRYPFIERGHVARVRNPAEIAAIGYALQLPDRQINLFNLHLESPRPGFEAVLNTRTLIDFSQVPRLKAVLARRSLESERASHWVAETEGPRIVMGDFNMPLDSTIFRRDWSVYDNAFSLRGWGFGFTKISEKRGWSYGARIDHVLYTRPWRCVRSFVADEIGSDHLPLVADFVLD